MNNRSAHNPDGLIRLNKYLAQCGLGSRRNCDTLISSGHILVNGEQVTEMGIKIDPATDTVMYKGKEVARVRPLEYYKFYKPKDTIVSKKDTHGRVTIYDFLLQAGHDAAHLKYAGRLDRDSEGLLILSNDGEMIHALTHPRFKMKKVYHVRLDNEVTAQDRYTMCSPGVVSRGEVLSLHKISPRQSSTPDAHWYTIELFEGKNRQIRRVCEECGYRVGRIIRVQFGPVKLKGLSRGGFVALTPYEIKHCRNPAADAKTRP